MAGYPSSSIFNSNCDGQTNTHHDHWQDCPGIDAQVEQLETRSNWMPWQRRVLQSSVLARPLKHERNKREKEELQRATPWKRAESQSNVNPDSEVTMRMRIGNHSNL